MIKKKYKIKKAASGLQDVSVPEQGSYSNVLSSTSSLAAAGSQFGLVGGLLGGAAGLGIGMLQKSQQDRANRRAVVTNRDNKINRAYAGDEETINQAPQRFKKGTKMIEIEGKKTPEIHTDKNFKVKNLGSIPHSKGGNKVEAEEGDVVFNTQNSLAKFNKIATAITKGDKATLNKEKNKLPEDKGSKNQDGNRSVRRKSGNLSDYLTEEEIASTKNNSSRFRAMVDSAKVRQNRANVSRPIKQSSKYDFSKDYLTRFGNLLLRNTRYSAEYNPNTNKSQIIDRGANKSTPIVNINKPTSSKSTEIFTDGYKLPSQTGYSFPKTSTSAKTSSKAPIGTRTIGKTVRKTTPVSSVINTPQVGKFTPGNMDEPDLSPLKNSRSLDQVAESAKGMNTLDASSKAISSPSDTTSPTSDSNTGSKFNNVLQFAGVANNLFQGLKGERAIDEQYYNPTKLKYNDRSQSLRNQSNQAMNASISNARNLSGGSAGNLRANANAARLANLSNQGSIDEREQARADAISNQNVEIDNQAKLVNAQRRDNYQQLNMQNRAAKQAYIDQAASDIGQYGMAQREESYMRNRDRLASEAQMAGYQSINGRYQQKSNLDGSTYFEPDADSSITRFGTSGGNRVVTRKKTLGIFKKGVKAVK